MYYSAKINAFYADEFRGDYEAAGTWPADAVELPPEQYAEFKAQPPAGKMLAGDADGLPCWVDLPAIPHADLVTRTLTQARDERQPIISILDGLQASALAKADSTTALAIENVKQALRDITKVDLSACTKADEMRAAVLQAYGAIVTANPSIAQAFRGVIA